jgi:hypothetical protein
LKTNLKRAAGIFLLFAIFGTAAAFADTYANIMSDMKQVLSQYEKLVDRVTAKKLEDVSQADLDQAYAYIKELEILAARADSDMIKKSASNAQIAEAKRCQSRAAKAEEKINKWVQKNRDW